MTMDSRNGHNYKYNSYPCWSIFLMVILPCLLVITFAPIRPVGAAAGASDLSTITEFSNAGGAGMEFEASSTSSLEDEFDDETDSKQQAAAGVCISSSNSISRSFFSGSYNALTDQDVHDISTIGGPRAHVYGEMTPRGFRQFAHYTNLTQHDVFVDLGSGVGSLVIQAALEFGVARSIGVELSVARHQAAVQSFQQLTQSITSTTNTNTTTRDNNYNDVVTFVQGDAASGQVVGPFLANATVVWISNLLFDEALNQALVRVIQEYAGPNLRVIASLKPLVRASSTKTTLSTTTTTTRNDNSINNGGGESIKGFEMQSFKVPFEMSWTAGIHNQQQDEYDRNHEAVSSPSPGHYCSILLRRRRQQ